MESRLRGIVLMMFGLLSAAVTGCAQPVTDTGHLGTWERELMPGRFSRVALWEEDGRTYFCWSSRGKDNGERMRCAPGGISETVALREVIYEYRFTVRPGDAADELLLDVEGVPRKQGTTPIRWTDRLIVQPGGMELWSYRISLNDTVFETPRSPLRFTKVADVPI